MNIDIKSLCNDVRGQAKATPAVVSFPPVYELVTACAARWPDSDDLCRVLRSAGLSPGDYDLSGTARLFWADTFSRAWNRMELEAMLNAIEREYPSRGGFTPRTVPSTPGSARFDR
jgi:hypothetical protein